MSIRTWLNSVYRGSLSRSLDTGYLKVQYANGRYVAVGGQLNPATGQAYPSTNTSIGGTVTAKLCSWSTNGIDWTDSAVGLPAAGTSVVYNNLSWNGTLWVACAGRDINNAWTTTRARSADAVSWVTTGADSGILINSTAASSNGRFLFVGARRGVSIADLTWNTNGADLTTNLSSYAQGSFTTSPTAAAASARGWMAACTANALVVTTLGSQWTGSSVPWGTNDNSGNTPTTNQRWVMALASNSTPGTSDGSVLLALVSSTPMSNPAATRITPTRIYHTANNGQTWTGPYDLPYDPTTNLGPYWDLCWNGRFWCCVGYGACALSMDGITWTSAQIPAGLWRSVTTDGDSFVAVSADGWRIKMNFDESSISTGAIRMFHNEFVSEIIEEIELPAQPEEQTGE